MPELTLYTRAGCSLCDEMKEILAEVLAGVPHTLAEIDVGRSPELEARFGHEVPVLFVDGRKAFKYRLTARDLRKRLMRP